mgnify:CR=1 FL=1
MADRSKPRLVQETPCGDYLFAWEEYWTEDNRWILQHGISLGRNTAV